MIRKGQRKCDPGEIVRGQEFKERKRRSAKEHNLKLDPVEKQPSSAVQVISW